MKISDLKLAVECCTSNALEWEETCGRCPLNKYKSEDEDPFDHIVCIDSLLNALAAYLPNEKCPHCQPPYEHFGKYYIKTDYPNDPGLHVLRRDDALGGVMINYCPICGRELED